MKIDNTTKSVLGFIVKAIAMITTTTTIAPKGGILQWV